MTKKLLAIFFCCLILGILFFSPSVEATISQKKTKAVVVIDVGHGGMDPGKVSPDGTKEKDLNLEIAKYLKDYLIAQDFVVYLDRDCDKDLATADSSHKKSSDMRNRIQFFNEKKADYVISIHQNSFPDASSHGAQVFYYSKSDCGKKLANEIQKELLLFDDTNKRQAKENDNYYILTNSDMPTVIVECGFLSNYEEASNLQDENYQKQLAYYICKGFCKYWQKNGA